MTKRKRRQVLTVRVEFEPNRFSHDCLQQAYQRFSPTVAVSLSTPLNTDEAEPDQQADPDILRPSRSPQ
ncbi:hypothetical protein [Granulosicoccus antarcticus]|uniref:Uncharacterized protein n=1 Tax=Granulosicoccus antarcticus IMCC3135 TaxID=1192854 RepID=A0A2Z2NVP9_9GAMM|nr:hypothetical protein [Granulosicoccus antarcticus]ASJ74595.1 hypothetical protein IMCC3135_22625 [Granulosicoccus antarcticus IMCC3135]